MPALLPLLFLGTGTGLGAYLEAKNKEDETNHPYASPLSAVSPTTLAYYAALGLGIYWLAKKSGAVK
jgi:hypothetical protein